MERNRAKKMANNMIDNKIQKCIQSLDVLRGRRAELDRKIKAKEKELLKYEDMKKQAEFDEVTQVIHSKGLTIEDIKAAVQNGDLLNLQEKIEEQNMENA